HSSLLSPYSCSFVFTRTSTPKTSTLSLHDALPISASSDRLRIRAGGWAAAGVPRHQPGRLRQSVRTDHAGQAAKRKRSLPHRPRSEEHTSELQSRENLVCRLLLEKKKQD